MSHPSNTTVLPAQVSPSAPTQPRLRLWPGVLLIAALWAIRETALILEPSPTMFTVCYMMAPMIGTALVCLWWLLLSRLPLTDRFLYFGVFLAGCAVTSVASKTTFPFMSMILYGFPVIVTVWVLWLVATYRLSWPARRKSLLAVMILVWIPFNLLRVDGVTGEFNATFTPRWYPTAEDRLLESLAAAPQTSETPATETAQPGEKLELSPGDWPGFRGAARDGRLTGVEIGTDWKTSPPKQLWRHLIGPGWSSFSVIGNRAYTQEQRGDDELVVCYDLDNGDELWVHRDATRFAEVMAGPGPRSTPTFDDGAIYALGANGTLNCLDAATGALVWKRDIVEDSGAKVPMWGFASSPLVAQGIVSVFAGGPEKKAVVGYDAKTGDLKWSDGEGLLSYCSPQLARLDGVEQLLIATEAGLSSLKPDTGEVLWAHEWPTNGVVRIIQPALLGDTDVVIGTGMGVGTRRIHVGHDGDAWPIEELWTVKSIKPYYNDLVVDGDYLYGFDGSAFMCVGLEKGKARWREPGYGNGQVLLIADQHLLLVLTEEGEVALVKAEPKRREEIARFKAIEGKTWNHPVIAHGKLLVRNAEEVACFELPAAGGGELGLMPRAGDDVARK